MRERAVGVTGVSLSLVEWVPHSSLCFVNACKRLEVAGQGRGAGGRVGWHGDVGRGCARGIATTDPELSDLIEMEWGAQRIINLYAAWRSQLVDILKRFGMTSIKQLRGRTDCLIYQK